MSENSDDLEVVRREDTVQDYREGEAVREDFAYDPAGTLAEERVVILRARSHTEAHRRAKVEANEYVKIAADLGSGLCNRWRMLRRRFEEFAHVAGRVHEEKTTRAPAGCRA